MCKVSHLAQSYPRTYFRPTTAGPQDKAQTLEFHRHLPPDGATMKTILLMTAVLVLAGCGDRKGTTSGADTSAMAPAATDTAMTHSDTAMTRDTAH